MNEQEARDALRRYLEAIAHAFDRYLVEMRAAGLAEWIEPPEALARLAALGLREEPARPN